MSEARWILEIGGLKISETIVVSWVIMAMLTVISILLTRNLKKVPTSKVQLFLEFAISSLTNLVRENMGDKILQRMPDFIPYLGSLFLFFTMSNLAGLMGFRSPTVDLNTTVAWACMTMFLVYYVGVKFNGLSHFKGLAEPSPVLLPINILGEFAKIISLACRPFGNILGGAVIMGLIYQFLGFLSSLIPGINGIPVVSLLIPIPLHMYLDLFSGLLQPFIFVMLTMAFVGMSVE